MLVDGRSVTAVTVADRGLHYGDGLFETIAVVDGKHCLWERHWSRLASGCMRLGIPVPDRETLQHEAEQLSHGTARAVLKLILTRGDGGRGYRPPQDPQPRRILSLHDWPDYPDDFWSQGIRVRWCETPLGLNPALAGIKHCNRLEQVLARAEWDDPEVPEGLMCDAEGRVIEGTQTNLFLWRDGELLTPALDDCGVAGVARGLLMELAKGQGIPVHETALNRDDLRDADALLLSNALVGIWPVRQLAEKVYDPVHYPAALMAALMERIHRP